jgi:hypothetical protein
MKKKIQLSKALAEYREAEAAWTPVNAATSREISALDRDVQQIPGLRRAGSLREQLEPLINDRHTDDRFKEWGQKALTRYNEIMAMQSQVYGRYVTAKQTLEKLNAEIGPVFVQAIIAEWNRLVAEIDAALAPYESDAADRKKLARATQRVIALEHDQFRWRTGPITGAAQLFLSYAALLKLDIE